MLFSLTSFSFSGLWLLRVGMSIPDMEGYVGGLRATKYATGS